MRSHHQRVLLAATAGAGAMIFAGRASAQTDTNPPLPDVLLMIDTSGSMELMMDGCNPDATTPSAPYGTYADGSACPVTSQLVCDGVTVTNQNRWAVQMAALTGSFGGPGYSCLDMPRAAGSNFVSEYALQYSSSSVSPYDENYYLNYHRPVENLSASSACAIGFDQSSTGWVPDAATSHQEFPNSPSPQDFSLAAIRGYQYYTSVGGQYGAEVTPHTSSTCNFLQNADGLISQAQASIRFGLMTFDNDTLANTGVTVTSDGANAAASGLNLTFNDVANSSLTSTVTTGMWSYFSGWENGTLGGSYGKPAGCTTCPTPPATAPIPSCVTSIPFEVGARNPAAPPWEGRLMRFPLPPQANPTSNNAQIMQAITAMRPYGANPIAGMFDDAKYYFWLDPSGPQNQDTYFSGGCRPSYIILLSHAAPNLDLQTYCQGTVNGTPGFCPYDYPENIAAGLAKGSYTLGSGVTNALSASASGTAVKTYVVGFVPASNLTASGETSSSSTLSCNDVLIGTGSSTTINTSICGTEPTNGGDAGAPTNTNAAAYASCCALARIAVSGGTGHPYFADNSTDLSVALQTILGLINSTTSTRATPVVLPQTANTGSGGGAVGETFISSFTAATGAPWSGDVQRESYLCSFSSGSWASQTPAPNFSAGDDFANDMQSSAPTVNRNVIVVEPYPSSSTALPIGPLQARVSRGNIRPYVNGPNSTGGLSAQAFDYYSTYDGEEYGYSYASTGSLAIPTTAITPDALGYTTTSPCTFTEKGTATPFANADCETIAFNYLLGLENPPASWNPTLEPFPARFFSAASVTQYSPFGGVYHSTPAVVPPPGALLRDDSYQAFVTNYTTNYTTDNGVKEPRHSVLYAATIDGLVHAFGVDYNPNDNYTFNGNHDAQAGTKGLANEMWSFVPPAVMPNLLSTGTFATSSTVLTDGPPVVKDTVYQRSGVNAAEDWHTTLVAGIGSAAGTGTSPGYYALDVTDPDFTRRGSSGAAFTPSHAALNSGTPAYMSTAALPQGPHFLWQLTFQSPTTDEPAAATGGTVTSLAGTTNDSSYIFAAYSGQPAITTLFFDDPDSSSTTPIEVGVAILPGGAAASPGSSTGACARVGCNGAATGHKCADASPGGSGAEETPSEFVLSEYVRQWGASCSAQVAGRTISIVRLDNGEVIRTFGQINDFPNNNLPLFNASAGTTSASKSPATLFTQNGRFTAADFDSPISGTPVPYPSGVGLDAQKIFFGDQDGTVWVLDVSDQNPNNWYVEPFMDAFNEEARKTYSGTPSEAAWALDRAPLAAAPIVTAGRDGHLLLNFGTGDQSAIGQVTTPNYAYSVSYEPGSSATSPLYAYVNWYLLLPNAPGEMVTGPQSVFDGTYYFASYAPGSGTACALGYPYLWGMDFQTGASSSNVNVAATAGTQSANGGLAEMVNPYVTGGANVQDFLPESSTLQKLTAIIPGVAITSTAACASSGTTVDPVTGGTSVSLSNVQPATYSLTALVGAKGSTVNAAGATANVGVTRQTLASAASTATLVDSWASIVE